MNNSQVSKLHYALTRIQTSQKQSLRSGYDLQSTFSRKYLTLAERETYERELHSEKYRRRVAPDAPQVERAHINCFELHVAL